MMFKRFLSFLFVLCFPAWAAQARVESIKKIWDQSEHNAFTDLIYVYDQFLCTFREADSHVGGQEGRVRVLASSDAENWCSIALIVSPGYDLRDPKLSQMPDGRLMLLMGAAVYSPEGVYLKQIPAVSFSTDGKTWGQIHLLEKYENEWIWRLTWYNGVGYGASYHIPDLKDFSKPWTLQIFKTTDGLQYESVTPIDVTPFPNETTLRFDQEGRMVALVRRSGMGMIGSAPPPYRDWTWFETGYRLGGPDFLILPDGQMWASSRKIIGTPEKFEESVILAKMSLKEYEPVITFPSSGDSGYPGMVYKDGKLYISYYTSHEGKSSIYLAIVKI